MPNDHSNTNDQESNVATLYVMGTTSELHGPGASGSVFFKKCFTRLLLMLCEAQQLDHGLPQTVAGFRTATKLACNYDPELRDAVEHTTITQYVCDICRMLNNAFGEVAYIERSRGRGIRVAVPVRVVVL